jgi:hypothetical protein
MLTTRQVEKLRKTPGRHGDGHGLYLQVGKGGKASRPASWILRYQRNGRVHDLGLGPLHTVGLEQARKLAKAARLQLLDGANRVEQRRQLKQQRMIEAAKAMTFADAVEQFFTGRSHTWSFKHRQQFTNSLQQYAVPVIGSLRASSIDVPLVLKVLEQQVDNDRHYPAGPFWQARPSTAMRLRGRIEQVLDWAKHR